MTLDHDPSPPAGPDAALPTAPATGALDPYFTELASGEEPVVVGTLFLTIVILIIIVAFWVVIYSHLIGR